MADKNNDNLNDANIEDEEYIVTLVDLEDEDGNKCTFEVIDEALLGDTKYVALVPDIQDAEEMLESDAEMIIMRVSEEGEYINYDIVEDNDELYAISEVFYNRLSEMYDIDLDKDE